MQATWEDVQRKMAELQVTGWSSMGDFSPDEHMAHLAELERIRKRRNMASCSEKPAAVATTDKK